MEYIWSDFWTTRGGSSSFFPRRGTPPKRGPYEVLGACRSPKPARFLGGSNVMEMIHYERPCFVDFHAAAALDSFPVFWDLPLGLFQVVSASRDLGFSPWVFRGVFCIVRSLSFPLGCFRCFLNFTVRVGAFFI